MIDPATRTVYEAQAERWHRARRPLERDRAVAFGRRIARQTRSVSGPVIDIGCGPGWYTTALGPDAIALDGAHSMLQLAAREAPGAPLVHADLAQLPFATRSVRGAWANASYVHLPRSTVPMAWHELHRVLRVGALAEISVFRGDAELTSFDDDDFPGRRFSLWPADLARAVLHGAGFTVTSTRTLRGRTDFLVLRARRERSLADTVGAGMRLLLVGLNPSEYAADRGVGFARPGNRFWPAALASGIVTRDRDPCHALLVDRVGMTDLVKRATPRADALGDAEYREGIVRIGQLVSWLQPRAVGIVGLSGWRAAVDRRASVGEQPDRLSGRPVYVMPNPSGLNAHTNVDDLAAHLRAAAALADRAD